MNVVVRCLLVSVLFFAAAEAACTPPDVATAKPMAQGPSHSADAADDSMRPQTAVVVIETPGGVRRFTVELAITDAERQKGLMFREHMDDDAGMLFLFEKQRQLSFWMKNTHLPLDMLFIDEAGTVAGIVEDAEPMTTTSRKVDAPSRYVLELNAGISRKLALAAGQRVHFEGVPKNLYDARMTP